MGNCNSCKDCNCGHAHKEVKVRFCPECKATDVKFVFQLQNLFGLVPKMTCMQCGNHAPDFPILVVPAKPKKKAAKKKVSKNKSRSKKA
ncbi:hypothetical protein HN747_02510 [archaeon]|jgi:hypothetical protein|nr:hypothetical protein [archaeon]